MSHGPQQLKDRIVQSRIHRKRDQFIASIHQDDVCRLASSFHNGDPCEFFKPPARGSYNICYFVQFLLHSPDAIAKSENGQRCRDEDTEKWVVRVPLTPCLAFGRRNKLESEIATMQLVAQKTTIPIPRIYAYSLADGPEPLSSFLILEYIEGEKLSSTHLKTLSDEQRTRLYTSLADIHIQLRRLEFPSIGCLIHGSEGFEVHKKAVTIDINMQELEGLQPSKIQASYYSNDGILTSANDYMAMLLQIADNAFVKGRSSVFQEDQGKDALYHLYMFRQYAEGWIDRSLDQGPFILVHGDLEPFNLIVNENMEILSVLDWEWSRVVPRQLFKPPLWLKNPDTTWLAWDLAYNNYLKSFEEFCTIMRIREYEKYGNELLSDEWAKAKKDSGFLVANALENWTDMDWFANRYINWKCYRGKIDLDERVRAFIEEDPARSTLIMRKLQEGIAYKVEVDRLENNGSPSERKDERMEVISGGTDKPASEYAIMEQSFLYQLWKNTISLFTPAVPKLALGSAVIVIAGTLYLLRKRIIRFPFPS